MRAIGWKLLPLLLLACGDPPAQPQDPAPDPWPVDGFLRALPGNASVVARLASADRVTSGDGAVAALLDCFGYSDGATLMYATPDFAGIDRSRSAGFARGTDGSWLHFLPAADKGRINAALRARADRVAVREEDDWIVIGTGAAPAPGEAEPLPRGDAALRVVHHPLLDAIAQPGDRLELGLTLLGGGFEAAGNLVPGKGSPTADMIRRAGGALTGQLDLLPAWLAVRFESTIPTTAYATFLARRIALHTGLPEGDLRDNMERFLREATTGIEAKSGLAVGIDISKEGTSFIAVGRVAAGPASPVLAKLRRNRRTTFGGLVLDAREMKTRRMLGYYAWVPLAEPSETGLPRTALPMLGALVQEDEGVLVACTEVEGYAVLAVGPRADKLARAARRRIAAGAKQSAGTRQSAILRERHGGECILAAVIVPELFADMADSDAGALRSALGATTDANPPKLIALAGFRTGPQLALAARVIYW